MRAITIRPPWSQIIAETAALTALGVKPKAVENRSRPVADKHIGTDIAIHAGLAWSPVGGADPRVQHAWQVFANAIGLRKSNPLLAAVGDTRTGFVGALRVPSLWIDQGAVVAVATLLDCHPAISIPDLPGHPAHVCCAPWGEPTYSGKPAWHLVLGNVRRLRDPVPATGNLAMPWTLRPDLADHIESAVTA